MMPLLGDHIKKIAILRANAIGDFVVALPSFCALRAAYPEAEIVLLGKPWHQAFLAGRPGPIDRVVVIPPIAGLSSDEDGPAAADDEQAAFFNAMRREGFDLALQMHGGGRHSNPFVLQLGARHTAGTRSEDAMALERWIPYQWNQHETWRSLEVVGLVGAGARALTPHLEVTLQDQDEARPFLDEFPRHAPLVVINPGARDPRRRWPLPKFSAVANGLSAQGAFIVINGSRGEHELGRGLCAGIRGPSLNLCGELSLRALLGILARSRLMLSNDTGPLHLALALGVPSVSIFWIGNLLTYGPLHVRHSYPHIAWQMSCPVCQRSYLEEACQHQDSMVAEVDSGAVRKSALHAFTEKRRKAPAFSHGDIR